MEHNVYNYFLLGLQPAEQHFGCFQVHVDTVAVVVQSVRVFTSHAEGWVFEYQPQQFKVVQTGSDSSSSKHHSGVNVMGQTVFPCHSRCGRLKNPHCALTMSAEY